MDEATSPLAMWSSEMRLTTPLLDEVPTRGLWKFKLRGRIQEGPACSYAVQYLQYLSNREKKF